MTISELIKERLTIQLAATQVELKDQSFRHRRHAEAQNGGGHYALQIASPLFQNKSLIECHRLIYSVLDDLIPAQIHALQIQITEAK